MTQLKETSQEINPFRDFLDAITVKEYWAVRDKILASCIINQQIFRNWKNGITAVPELAKPIINKIARTTQAYKNADVFTIEEMKP